MSKKSSEYDCAIGGASYVMSKDLSWRRREPEWLVIETLKMETNIVSESMFKKNANE